MHSQQQGGRHDSEQWGRHQALEGQRLLACRAEKLVPAYYHMVLKYILSVCGEILRAGRSYGDNCQCDWNYTSDFIVLHMIRNDLCL